MHIAILEISKDVQICSGIIQMSILENKACFVVVV